MWSGDGYTKGDERSHGDDRNRSTGYSSVNKIKKLRMGLSDGVEGCIGSMTVP